MVEDLALTIRRGVLADADMLSDLGARIFSDSFAAFNKPQDIAMYLATAFNPARQAAELSDPHTTFLIADVDQRPAGYARLVLGPPPPPECVDDPDAMEIARFYVSHPWHGTGVAAQLMAASIDHARALGRRTIWLGVWQHNPRALAFYRKWNFREVGEHRFEFGTDTQSDIVMQRSVDLP